MDESPLGVDVNTDAQRKEEILEQVVLPNRKERRRKKARAKKKGDLTSAQKAFRARQARKNKRRQARKK